MKLIRSLFLFACSLYFFSCRPSQKISNYLQNVSDSTVNDTIRFTELRIQKNDLLSIQVYSASTRPELSDVLYNIPETKSGNGSSTNSGGYLVDLNGNIEYPRIGRVHAEGLTKQQLADTLKRRVNEKDSVLVDPTFIIRYQNLKITVLGEVNNQGVLTIPTEKVTILEAIGLAGGVNDYGVKDKVKVMREANGKREVGVVDLSSRDLFNSPYYNLMQNDIVLVDPTTKKAKKADQDITFQRIGLGLTIVTTIALLYSIFKN